MGTAGKEPLVSVVPSVVPLFQRVSVISVPGNRVGDVSGLGSKLINCKKIIGIQLRRRR